MLEGSVLMDPDEELVAPTIEVRPNKAIPITIGVFLVLGGLFTLLGGVSTMYNGTQERNQSYYDSQVVAMSILGVETTVEDLQTWDEAMLDAGFFTASGAVQTIAGLGMVGSAVLLFMGRKLGVWVGAGATGLNFFGSIVLNQWASSIETDIGISLQSSSDVLFNAISMSCGLFCFLLPFVPLMFAAGRAALD